VDEKVLAPKQRISIKANLAQMRWIRYPTTSGRVPPNVTEINRKNVQTPDDWEAEDFIT
jgi:hypothetical protein